MATGQDCAGYGSRTYGAALAPLLVVAPTARELGGLVGDRQAGFATAVTGIGHRAGPALADALQEHRISAVLSLGFAGALAPGLSPGDLIIHDTIMYPGERAPMGADPGLTEAAMEALNASGVHAARGDLLTVHDPILSAAGKHDAGQRWNAVAVDMEGFDLAAVSEAAAVPMLSIRAILDEMDHDLPRFVGDIIADGGRREWWHTIKALRDPLALRSLVPLVIRSRTAGAALRRAAAILAPALAAPLRPRA